MNNASPRRYPGGKSTMAGLLGRLRKLNGIGDRLIAEPFAGGAGAALGLLYNEEAPSICINDADPAIFDLWWSLLHQPDQFAQKLSGTRVSMAEWRRQRDAYRSRRPISRLRRGFAAFYLNRCNRSGIIMNGGPIGGIKQKGKWKLDARYNKRELQERCTKIAEYSDRIAISGLDGLQFIEQQNAGETFFFIDPPYYAKGKTLYLNALDDKYHRSLADKLRAMRDTAWVLTYDDCPQIRKMYRDWARVRPFALRYSATERRQGKEIMIVPKWMRLPSSQESGAIAW